MSVNQPIHFNNNDFVENKCQDYLNTDVYEPDYLALRIPQIKKVMQNFLVVKR